MIGIMWLHFYVKLLIIKIQWMTDSKNNDTDHQSGHFSGSMAALKIYSPSKN